MNRPLSDFPNLQRRVPAGDSRERLVCENCEWIHYENPRIIVTGFCLWENSVLLARRAIAPRRGFWSLPGGFMEVGETPEEGAAREVQEECGAAVSIESLLAVYAIPRIGQVHMVYLARMESADFLPGEESLDVRLFDLTPSSIPSEELAFPVNRWLFDDWFRHAGSALTVPFTSGADRMDERMGEEPWHPNFPPE
ncbi:MAG TPA: NUDIX hydrolase [Planctomycetaceae bacterium]|nr:NUDIX hydrolase [Planctomycetaceae bacterium]|tara:strand:- start:245 stop:832 length:588 start_codon:yes stop_codon:yes gene_type:complete